MDYRVNLGMFASGRILKNFAAAVAALGFDPKTVFERASLSWTDLEKADDEEHRIPVEALGRFWTAVVEVTGDPAIGVRIGALARLGNYGVVGGVLRASATLGDALLKTARYMNLLIETARLSVLVDGEQGQVIYRSVRVPPPAADAALAQLLVLSRELTGRELVPTQVCFAHRAPPDDSTYRKVFGVAPTFDGFEHLLVFPSNGLMLPIATHDSRQTELLVAQASRLAAGLSPEDSVSRRVREVLAGELHGGNPMLENVAAQLGIHPKALMRRLKQEGTSHSDLLDSLRREYAERYLGVPRMNVAEAAFMLGFSDASAFNKAFRRWFGVTPLEFRRRLTHAKSS
ncbi:MAG TPA: AraC family transcriptional regulator [Polyangiaceae bacterium]|nr:AraC family transcriptional regulator [Polyangiaceae bacterium]